MTHVDEESIGLGGVSVKSVQQNIIINFAVWETLKVDICTLATGNIFENIFDTEVIQLIGN